MPLDRELLQVLLPPPATEVAAQVGIPDQCFEGGRQRSGVPDRHERARTAVVDDVGDSPPARRNHGKPEHHALDRHQPEGLGLVERGEAQDVGAPEGLPLGVADLRSQE